VSTKTKVFHIITKLELGGAQKVVLMTLERLPQHSYDLALVTGTEGLLVDEATQIPGVKVLWIPPLVREIQPVKDVLAFLNLWRLFRRERPHIVHTHSSKAGILGRWAAKLAGVPVIFHTVHGFSFNEFQRPLICATYQWLERVTARITGKMVVVAYTDAEKGEMNGVFKRGDWILCRAGIQIEEFMKQGSHYHKLKEWGVPEGTVVVGMVSNFKPQKSPVDFIDVAAAVLKQTGGVHFVMAGDGELRPEIESRIRKHGIGPHVTLLGWRNDMPEVYRNLDVVVLTSLWEGLPCVFSEAMANGLPIVATNVDGAREAIVDGENGYLHRPHNIDGMAQSVLQLVRDPELRRAMGRRGKDRVKEFDIGTTVATLEAAYRESLGRLQ
jgi:glycosyltransferase involved in cell wall biosynthesis